MTVEVYKKAGRNELLENENKEIAVISTFYQNNSAKKKLKKYVRRLENHLEHPR